MLEPVLALLGLGLTFAGRLLAPPDSPLVWIFESLMCLVGAFAAASPLLSVIAQMLCMLVLMIWGDGLAGLAMLAPNVSIFALVRLRIRFRWGLIGVLVATALLLFVVLPPRAVIADRVATTIYMVLMVALSVVAGNVWRKITLATEQERELSERRMSALRVALARDLHDTVAQTLSHTAMTAYVAADNPHTPVEVREELISLAAECNASAGDLRQLLSALREPGDATGRTGPDETLEATLEHQRARLLSSGFEPDIEVDIPQPSPAQSTTLSKISVEAVTNMIKHATPLSRCAMTIRSDTDSLTARFENATSARRKAAPGMGLVGVRERAALLGGTSEVTLADGVWTLTVQLPLSYAAASDEPAGAVSGA